MLRARRLVGRDAEVAIVADLVRHQGGRGGTVIVLGGAGMGKSALVRAATEAVDSVVGRATPPPAPALRPLCELALGLVRVGARVDDHRLQLYRGALGSLLPGLIERASDVEAVASVQLADALLRLRETVGDRPPRLLALEDLHWADPQTLATVESLADALHGTNIGLVLTARPEGPMVAVARRLVQRHAASMVELGPLDPDHVRDLVAECLGTDPPAGLVDALSVADGVPLFIEELLAAYAQRGDLARAGQGWAFRPTGPALPASLDESVSIRLDQLSGDGRQVIEAAAMLGREFDSALLPPALSIAPAAIDAALREAVVLGLLSHSGQGSRLRFAHALVRDVVLASATGTARREIAARLLAALAPNLAEDRDLELGAALARQAGRPAEAARLLAGAGRGHLARGLPAAAVDCFDQALASGHDPIADLAVRETLLQALALAGDADRASREAEVVRRQLAATGASDDRRRSCAIATARAAANAGRWADADALLAQEQTATGGGGSLHALVALNLGRFDEAERAAMEAVAAGDSSPASICEAAEVLGRLARRGDLEQAAAWFERAIATAELHGLALWQARARHELATVDQLRTLAVTRLEEARTAAIAAGAPGLLAAVDFHLAALHGVRFEPARALLAARRCLDTARRLGAGRQEAWAWNLIGQAHAVDGNRARAGAAAAEALALGDGDPEITGVAVGTARGLASLLAADRDRALEQWTEAIAALRTVPGPTPLPPWYLWPLLATVYDIEGDGGTRARSETDTTALRVAWGPDGLWHLADAVAHGRAGDPSAAEDAFRRSATLLASVPAFAGYIHLGRRIAAEAAVADGWGEPGEWLPEAADWFAGRNFDELAQSCRSLARRAGVRSRRSGRGGSAVPPHLERLGVTSREVDVLRLLAEGLTNRQIAERLFVAPRTVKGHVENLLSKTGRTNRTQLASLVGPDG